ncbi:undecaprenyl-diphosphatase [Virgibacillus subterraneus]|uniref:Undecaprenyl-diphosphatase n=2 Tax=Virgibacillus TaxID=84406 RepID=A0A1H1ECP2_9BACI|nr:MULTISPECIES: phosphatase PAP2 family protein [Virgibacillus]SDQ86515.1 undecaprenyl-diphosphatase [Virgibacillus salinus]SEQ41635.1 undecaprenyl-diphosphatase [Virgibacillus subterraneus]
MWNKRNYIIIFLFSIVIITLGTWVTRILTGQTLYVDRLTRGVVEKFDDSSVYTFFRWTTELGSEEFLVPFTIIITLMLWWIFRDWLPALVFGIGTLTSHGLNILIKKLVERERPSILVAANAEGYSFPSGHAMISMVCYGLLAYFITKNLTSAKATFVVQFLFALLIFLIGISRYMINVHYLTDVLAGFIFGFIFLVGLIYLYELIRNRRFKIQS